MEFLTAYNIEKPTGDNLRSSKWVYARAALNPLDAETVERIAEDLDINTDLSSIISRSPPEYWKETAKLRVFISHISKDKSKAMRLRDCLEPYAISAFVAHEDIEPTKQWENQLERALRAMDGFNRSAHSGLPR